MNILQIHSSPRGAQSVSSRLAQTVVDRLRAAHPDASVRLRDLGREPHPELDEAALQALFTPAEQRTGQQAARVALDDALIAELQQADVLVLAAPMYNFSGPVQLKHWIDAVVRAGVTFRYTANGPEGLLRTGRAIVVLSRGGVYRDTPADTQVPHLRSVFGLLGVKQVDFVYAEGLNMGDEAQARGLADAAAQIEALVPEPAVA